MPHLPVKAYAFYAGIDPGHHGALALINKAGTSLKVWDMPTTGDGKHKEIDLPTLRVLFKDFAKFPSVAVGIEWPRPKPGDFGNVAGDAEKFGRQKGYLEAFAFLMRLDYFRIDPLTWKGRLGLPGKTDPEANAKGVAYAEARYPQAATLMRGPRGGLRDGRLDALLIAHFLRSCNDLADTARTHGRGSTEVQAAILGFGGNRRSHRLRIR